MNISLQRDAGNSARFQRLPATPRDCASGETQIIVPRRNGGDFIARKQFLVIDYERVRTKRGPANRRALRGTFDKAFMSVDPKRYSLAEPVNVSKSNRRTVQFWVESGALRPTEGTDREGRGVHRRFCRAELILTCVLAAVFSGCLADRPTDQHSTGVP